MKSFKEILREQEGRKQFRDLLKTKQIDIKIEQQPSSQQTPSYQGKAARRAAKVNVSQQKPTAARVADTALTPKQQQAQAKGYRTPEGNISQRGVETYATRRGAMGYGDPGKDPSKYDVDPRKAAAAANELKGTGSAAEQLGEAGEQMGSSLTGSLQQVEQQARQTRETFQSFADQVVAMRYFDIGGIGATGGYFRTTGAEAMTLGAYEKLSSVFLANMEKYKQDLAAWVAAGRRGEPPRKPSTEGLEELAGASFRGIRGVPPEVFEAQEMLKKFAEYDVADWIRELNLGDVGGGGAEAGRVGRAKTTRSIALPSRPYDLMSRAQPVGASTNNINFQFNAGDALMQRDVKEWVTNEVVPILNELSGSGRIAFSTG